MCSSLTWCGRQCINAPRKTVESSALPSMCAKCGLPIGNSSLYIGNRIFHTECSPLREPAAPGSPDPAIIDPPDVDIEANQAMPDRRMPGPKQLISLRLDADLVAYMRNSGPGWQTRANNILRAATELDTAEI
jgi:uncharacterized protein (DUF4415 family)